MIICISLSIINKGEESKLRLSYCKKGVTSTMKILLLLVTYFILLYEKWLKAQMSPDSDPQRFRLHWLHDCIALQSTWRHLSEVVRDMMSVSASRISSSHNGHLWQTTSNWLQCNGIFWLTALLPNQNMTRLNKKFIYSSFLSSSLIIFFCIFSH